MSDLRRLAALVALAADFGPPLRDTLSSYPSRRDWSHIEHTYTEKPLTKRQKRRLRGKAWLWPSPICPQ